MYWSKEWQTAIEAMVLGSYGPIVRVIFIINGEDQLVEAFSNRPIGEAAERALGLSHNTGRPPEEWEIRTEAGTLVPPECVPPEIIHHPRYFLSLRVGVGGQAHRDRLNWQFFGSR